MNERRKEGGEGGAPHTSHTKKKKKRKEDDRTGRHEWGMAGILKIKKRGHRGVREQKNDGKKKSHGEE